MSAERIPETLPSFGRAMDDAAAAATIRASIRSGRTTILDLFDFLPWFKSGADWTAWRAFLCAVYALPMTEQEHGIYQRCTGRKDTPKHRAREVWVPVGRRGRKSAIAALMAVYEGLKDWSPWLAPGERAMIPIIAKNKADASTIHSFASAILRCPSLAPLVGTGADDLGVSDGDREEPLKESIALVTGVDLVIRAASLTAGRSKASPLALLDECAFFSVEGNVSDEEIVRGIRPSQANLPEPMLAAFSSPYARRGLLWEQYRQHYGVEGDRILVWQAPTLWMQDTAPLRAEVADAYETDEVSAKAEYGAQFREDVIAFVSEETIRAATDIGVEERPPVAGVVYYAFCDPAGGGGPDSMTLGIAHWEPPVPARKATRPGEEDRPAQPQRTLLDFLYEWHPPFDPLEATSEAAGHLKRYSIHQVRGDAYAGDWPSAAFQRDKISYYVSDRNKTRIYRDVLPLIKSREARLLDSARLRTQFTGLDRFTARGGNDTIDHPRGGHDDVANSASGAVLLASEHQSKPREVPEATTDDTRELTRRKIRNAVNASIPKAPRPNDVFWRKRR